MALLSILDMHRLLDQELQSMGFFSVQGLAPEEIDLQINAQIDNFVEAVVDKHKKKQPRIGVKEGFQENQVRLDDLRTIQMKDVTCAINTYGSDGFSFSLPGDYSHHIKTKVVCSYDCQSIVKGKSVPITNTVNPQIRIGESEDIENMRNHPFYKTTLESPLAEIVGNTVFVYTNNTDSPFTITSAKMDYIRKPAVVKFNHDNTGNYNSVGSIDCDLPHTVHRQIVSMTAIHIITILESSQQKLVNLVQETN